MSEDVTSEVIKKTQKYLGKYVKKPALTEKLLRKPPFRFLHDVIVAVIKETGFLKGLYNEKELVSDNVKDKDAKIAFLTKLIEAVKTLTKTELKVKPSKIVAGLEPTETNVLLQTIAKAIDKKLDSNGYVNKLNSGEIPGTTEKKRSKKSDVKNSKENLKQDRAVRDAKKKTTPIETPKSTDRSKSKVRSKDESKDRPDAKSKSKTRRESKEKLDTADTGKPVAKDEKLKKHSNNESSDKLNNTVDNQVDNSSLHISGVETDLKKDEDTPNQNTDADLVEHEINDVLLNNRGDLTDDAASEFPSGNLSNDNNKNRNEEQNDQDNRIDNNEEKNNAVRTDQKELKIERRPSASLVRPKSARPKSGDLKQRTPPVQVAIINEQRPEEPVQKAPRPGSSLRPPSVRPSSARPGAPRLRPDSALPMEEVVQMGKINVIVESFDKDADEDEETVVIQNSPDMVEAADELLDIPLENKGHLVEQILEQINESSVEGRRPKIEIDWDRDSFRSKDATAKELKELRSLIQTLTKTANPLGKLLNYLHEDIEAMQNELETWTNTKRQLLREITKQKRISEEASQPLLQHLETLSQDIRKQEQEILTVRSNILRNEIRIKELLTK